jgi:uncharacterized protein (DUF4415 family)
MISDEPDEDADSLDDGGMIEAVTGLAVVEHGLAGGAAGRPADWPAPVRHGRALVLDADILAWFQANHADWQRQIRGVLRGWIAAQ